MRGLNTSIVRYSKACHFSDSLRCHQVKDYKFDQSYKDLSGKIQYFRWNSKTRLGVMDLKTLRT